MAGSLSVRKKNAEAAQKRRVEQMKVERRRANQAATANAGELGSGIASIPKRVVNYIKTSTPSSFGRDVKGIAKATYDAAVEDPNAFIEDAVFSPLAAIRDFGDVRESARKLRAQGRDAEAEKMEAMAGTAVLSAVPILGRPAGVATRKAVKAASKATPSVKATPKGKAASEMAVTPKAKPKAAPKPKTAPAPRAAQLEGAETPFMVSTRRPTAPNYATQGNPDETLLIQTGEALRAAPPAFEKNMNMLAEEPFMRGMAGAGPERIYEEGVRRGADNLKFIMSDLMPAEKVEAARGWYPTANMVSARAAERAGLPPEAGYGVAAVTSPQTPWDINVARVDRMMDMYGDRFATDPAAARKYIQNRIDTEKKPGAIAALGPDYAERIAAMPYEELPDKFAKFARVSLADATRNDPMVRKIDLSGEYGDPYGSMTWGSGDSVSKALAIMDDPSMQSINSQLLGGGKVPSFFNNISNPYSASPISTIDTHSAGAASLFPGGGNDPIVYRAMGLGGTKEAPAAADVARTGSKGLYGPISDMHTLAAKEMGFDTPREVQSATWEGVRDLWGQAGKTPELKKAIADIWNNSSSPDEARFLIADLLGKPVRRMFQVK